MPEADTATPRLPRLRPRDRQVAELAWDGLSQGAIGRTLNRRPDTVAKILRQADVAQWMAVMDEKAANRQASQRVGARAKLAAHEELFADTLIDGVRSAAKPLDKVIAGEKGLGLLGIVAPKEVRSFSVEAKLKDCTLEELMAWDRDGVVPKALRAEYTVLPATDDA